MNNRGLSVGMLGCGCGGYRVWVWVLGGGGVRGRLISSPRSCDPGACIETFIVLRPQALPHHMLRGRPIQPTSLTPTLGSLPRADHTGKGRRNGAIVGLGQKGGKWAFPHKKGIILVKAVRKKKRERERERETER